MLRLDDISYSVEGRPLIEHASATIPTGHKVGLVGRNGTGKTTLFKLIRGELTLDTGSIEVPRGARIGGVAQEVRMDGMMESAARAVTLTINGEARELRIAPWTTLLDALREYLHMTGTKKGCDHGQCGSCTVLIDGKPWNSCLALAVMQEGRQIETIEGLSNGAELHPVQAAFVEHDGYQCGYCTPGQIMSATGMLGEVKDGWPSHVTDKLDGQAELTDAEISERMSGNICRCSAYPNIVDAIRTASTKNNSGGPA